MAKVVINARQLRLELAVRRGETVSLRQVAREIGEDHRKLMKLENNEYEEIPADLVAKVAGYYHAQGVDARGILSYDPDGQRTPDLVAA